jgi:cytochrome c-type biogenesis protein CcmH/NrfG
MMCDRLEEARDCLQKATKAEPENPNIWYDYGLTLATIEKGEGSRGETEMLPGLAVQKGEAPAIYSPSGPKPAVQRAGD